jgi:fatty-acyl-CoA synthase
VRLSEALPLTATGKITKAGLRAEGWRCAQPVVWAPGRGAEAYRPFTADDRRLLEDELERHGRARLLGAPLPGSGIGRT